MVKIFKHKTKDIILLLFYNSLDGTEKEPINRLFDSALKNINPFHHLVILDKTAALTNKKFISEASDWSNRHVIKLLSINIMGLSGITKLFFRMYISLLKQPVPTFIFDTKLELEHKFEISFRNDFKDEFIEYT